MLSLISFNHSKNTELFNADSAKKLNVNILINDDIDLEDWVVEDNLDEGRTLLQLLQVL